MRRNQRVSTTVEIILYYLTIKKRIKTPDRSTTVEIILYYLTTEADMLRINLQQ